MAASERPAAAQARGIGTPAGSRIFSGDRERLWKIWWLRGVPVAWATSILIIAAAESRLEGDIHFRTSNAQGLAQGRCVAGYVNQIELGE